MSPAWRRLTAGMLLVSLLTLTRTPLAVLNDAAVSSATLDALPRCLRWRPVGICLWLVCGYSCTVKTSIKVQNHVPDAYVNVTTGAAGGSMSPGDASGSIEGRYEGGYPRRGRDHQTFRDADLFGHPLSAASFAGVSGITGGLLCLPRSIPTLPYFRSTLDALVWRSLVPIESLYPAALIPGLREIGQFPVNTWGSVYPRTGRVLQQEEPKAGAVIAQRVGDIVTRFYQPHVYYPLDMYKLSDSGMRYWGPGSLVEMDDQTGDWQMLYPTVDNACEVFGRNDSVSLSSWSDGRKSDDGEYQFNLWRPYQCCKVKGIFIGSIGGW